MKVPSSCPVCGEVAQPWGRASDRHYGNPGTFDLAECIVCHARFLDPMPTEEQLGDDHPADYYSFGVEANTPAPPGLVTGLKRRLLPIGTREPDHTQPGVMLDLGCGSGSGSGSGWMVARYKALGWTAIGVNYNRAAADMAAAHGLDIRVGSLMKHAFPSSSFDYVRSNHSFEHLNNPHGVLDEVNRSVRPGGLLFIGVPDTSGLMARFFKKEWYLLGAPVHTIKHSRTNLRQLLERHGFEVQSGRPNSNHVSTVGSLQSWLISRPLWKGQMDRGMMSFGPTIVLGFWIARASDRWGRGDCVEVIARKPEPMR